MKTRNNLNEVILKYISFIEACHEKGLGTDYEYLTDSFIFDNITYLSNNVISEADFKSIKQVGLKGKDPKLKNDIKHGLNYLSRSLQELKRKRVQRHIIYPIPAPTVKSIFSGLEYSGNNDSSYKDVPSALALATFKV